MSFLTQTDCSISCPLGLPVPCVSPRVDSLTLTSPHPALALVAMYAKPPLFKTSQSYLFSTDELHSHPAHIAPWCSAYKLLLPHGNPRAFVFLQKEACWGHQLSHSYLCCQLYLTLQLAPRGLETIWILDEKHTLLACASRRRCMPFDSEAAILES